MNLPLPLLPALLLIFSSCSMVTPVKDTAVHYLLQPLVADITLSGSQPSIAISRPTLPGYLDRQQLVTVFGSQLTISGLDLWAEPLDVAIARVTASNLSRLTASSNIQPIENFVTLDYKTLLEIRINRFEPESSDRLILSGTWKLQPVSGGEVTIHSFRIIAPISPGPAAAARVTAMNQCLESLARQIIRKP